jgi:hypothetical protein
MDDSVVPYDCCDVVVVVVVVVVEIQLILVHVTGTTVPNNTSGRGKKIVRSKTPR